MLSEERDALRIEILIALDRRNQASAAAQHFLSTYPKSIHEQLARRALRETEPTP